MWEFIQVHGESNRYPTTRPMTDSYSSRRFRRFLGGSGGGVLAFDPGYPIDIPMKSLLHSYPFCIVISVFSPCVFVGKSIQGPHLPWSVWYDGKTTPQRDTIQIPKNLVHISFSGGGNSNIFFYFHPGRNDHI